MFLGSDVDRGFARGERMLDAIVAQGARLPSQRRFDARARSIAHGVRIPRTLYEEILTLLD